MTNIVDVRNGEIREDGIRYVMMRPDVLMGVAHELCAVPRQAFLTALAESAFQHAQASFVHYQNTQRFVDAQLLEGVFSVAARLGWGAWTLREEPEHGQLVEVLNSPFAAGFGRSDIPVCAIIVGILRAAMFVAAGSAGEVREFRCAAQGAPCCQFLVGSPRSTHRAA